MNLTQTQSEAKEAFLNRQQDEMLAIYQNADTAERNAIIKHIDSFLEVVPSDAKNFWLEFQEKLQILDNHRVLFSLGKVFMTSGAREALEESKQTADEFLTRHQSGDYGIICEDDREENELSLREGFRILSAYKTEKGEKIWVITEADRSSTTCLLPSEY